jgi:hypothetical protein
VEDHTYIVTVLTTISRTLNVHVCNGCTAETILKWNNLLNQRTHSSHLTVFYTVCPGNATALGQIAPVGQTCSVVSGGSTLSPDTGIEISADFNDVHYNQL